MRHTEHSRLLYLLDTIESAPNKFDVLIKMAEKPDSSKPYNDILEKLCLAGNSNQIKDECKKIRNFLR